MSSIFSLCLAFALTSHLIHVSSHSWLHCTDYDGTITGLDYDDSLCNGYTRNWYEYDGSSLTTFGAGDQLAYVGGDGQWCQKTINSPLTAGYTDSYPYATYYLGETITLVWPAKNHATHEDCPRISGDNDMVLYYNPIVDPTSDAVSMSDDWDVVIDWHEEDGTSDSNFAIAGRPYSNCPGFCDDSDKTPCFGEFEVTSEHFSQTGFYTFMWYWSGSGAYSMCYEAYVIVDEENPDTPDTNTNDNTNDNNNDNTDNTDNTDNNGNTNNDNTDNSNNDNNNDSDSEEEEEETIISFYDIYVTVCYTGDSYNEELISNAANSLFTGFDWTIKSYYDIASDEFNVTINVYSSLDDQSSIVGLMSDGSLCDAIIQEYDDGTDSSNDDVCTTDCSLGVYITKDETYNADNSKNGKNNGSEGGDSVMFALLAVVIIVVFIAVIIGVGMYCNKKNENGSVGVGGGASGSGGHEEVAATIHNSNVEAKQSNIMTTSDA